MTTLLFSVEARRDRIAGRDVAEASLATEEARAAVAVRSLVASVDSAPPRSAVTGVCLCLPSRAARAVSVAGPAGGRGVVGRLPSTTASIGAVFSVFVFTFF